jgi:hypothetical protein
MALVSEWFTPFRGDLLISAVAELSDHEIEIMDRKDLLDVIRLSRGLDGRPRVPRILKQCVTEQLLNFAWLARDKCREDLKLHP